MGKKILRTIRDMEFEVKLILFVAFCAVCSLSWATWRLVEIWLTLKP
jgi:hypothetical protein